MPGTDATIRDDARDDAKAEARRILEVCNACRYCESYCAVFPAMTLRREFPDGDLVYLANLCHDCRGCYYACQYAPPHEFALNLPNALSEIRRESWAAGAWPGVMAGAFRHGGWTLFLAVALGVEAMWLLAAGGAGAPGAAGFYAAISHPAMLAVFAPAFVFAVLAMALSVARLKRAAAAPPIEDASTPSSPPAALPAALHDAATLRYLGGGHGEGCNFEDADAYSNLRRRLHHAAFYGFALCFLATCAGTVLHYGFAAPAPYGFWSAPKLLGVPGGVLLCVGSAGLFWLKRRADPALAAPAANGLETGFLAILFLMGASGLALYALRDTPAMTALLALHLGAVLGFFLTAPYSKMVHGFHRLAALTRHAAEQSRNRGAGAP